MKKCTLSHAKDVLNRLLDDTQGKGKAIAITRGGKPSAVLISYDELKSIHNSNSIVSDKEFMDEIRDNINAIDHNVKGRVVAMEELAD